MSVFYRQIQAMGTRLEVIIPEIEESLSMHLWKRLSDYLFEIESKISAYIPDSELNSVNSAPVGEIVEVSDFTRAFIEAGMEHHPRTNGLFDFTLGVLTCKASRKDEVLLSIEEMKKLPMDERIEISEAGVRRLHSSVILDSGGIGKGIALGKCENILRDAGISSAFISFGGSSVLGVGSHPYGDCWKVGLEHSLNNQEAPGELKLKDSSLSISGNSENNRKKFGAAGHIINPVSGKFYKGNNLVAVVCPDPLEAEVLSTALLHADRKDEEEICSRYTEAEVFKYYSE